MGLTSLNTIFTTDVGSGRLVRYLPAGYRDVNLLSTVISCTIAASMFYLADSLLQVYLLTNVTNKKRPMALFVMANLYDAFVTWKVHLQLQMCGWLANHQTVVVSGNPREPIHAHVVRP